MLLKPAKYNHEQHTGAASCRSRFESQWETPNFDHPGSPNYWGIKLKNCSINYLGCLTKRVKFRIYNPSGLIWAMGEIYTTWGHTAAPGVPKHVFPCKEVPFGGIVDILSVGGFYGQKLIIWGPEIANRIIEKIAI